MILIPAAGLGAAWLHDDPEGAKQLLLSVGASQAIVQMTKHTVSRHRPNEGSQMSFLSGHTASAFSGASFLQSRYGWKWGLPAYAAATFVGYSRVHGNRHFADDVLVGAGISFLVNQYLVSPFQSDTVSLLAAPTGDGIALGVSVSNEHFEKPKKREKTTLYKPELKHRFELNIGFNLEDSLGKAGVPGDTLVDQSQPFGAANYTYTIDEDSHVQFELAPNETRRRGAATQAFSYGGQDYAKGEQGLVALKQCSAGVNYFRDYKINDQLDVSLGGSFNAHYLEGQVDLQDGVKHSRKSKTVFMPGVIGKADYEVIDNLQLFGSAQYQQMSKDKIISADARLRYDLSKTWDVSLSMCTTITSGIV